MDGGGDMVNVRSNKLALGGEEMLIIAAGSTKP